MEEYEDYGDQYQDDGQKQNNPEVDLSMKLPIKNHVTKLDDMLDNIMKDLEDSKKEMQSLRNDIVTLGHLNNETTSEISKFIMDETLRLARDFRKLQAIEADETLFLKQQVGQLTQDRIRLQQNTLVLENRVIETEKDIGFKYLYD